MYYTYLWLREDGTPYYVGKGTGNRAFTNNSHRQHHPPKERIIIYPESSEDDAFETEIALIWYYGRKDLGTGCLRNLTDGGENPPNHKGKKHTVETKIKMSTTAMGIAKRPVGYKHTDNTRQKMRHKHVVKIRTHCIRGHERLPENMRSNGRSCALCELITQRERRLRKLRNPRSGRRTQ